MLLASCILDADWWIFHRVLNLKLHADRGKSPGGSSQLPTRLLKRCFVVFLSSTNEKQREKVVVCVWMLLTGPPPAPASFYSGWRSAIFPAPPTDLELLEDVSGHWELSAVKRLCYLRFSRWRTHTSHCSCESWGCVKSATPQLRERPATSSRLIIKSWRRSDDKVAAADHLSPTLLKV